MKLITFTLSARKSFRGLPADVRVRVMDKLERYAATGAGDVTALQSLAGFRMRIGDYRAVFVETDTAIEVRAVGHRRDIYR
jgi:mRNA interferase RelE/StbE